MTPRLAARRLYVADLLRRQAAWESGLHPMHALSYRVMAKRLQSTLAEPAAASLCQSFPELPPQLRPLLMEALETRHFDDFGLLQGPGAEDARSGALELLARLR